MAQAFHDEMAKGQNGWHPEAYENALFSLPGDKKRNGRDERAAGSTKNECGRFALIRGHQLTRDEWRAEKEVFIHL
jgi:hypothetical protein